jgi:hypothetical protein
MEDMRYLYGGYGKMIANKLQDVDINPLRGPAYLKTSWANEELEIENYSYPAVKHRGKWYIQNVELDRWEGLRYRFYSEIPERVKRIVEYEIRRKWRQKNKKSIDEMKNSS